MLEEAGLTPALDAVIAGGDVLDVTFRVYVDFQEKPDGTREVVFETGGGTVGTSLTYEAESRLVARTTGNGGFSLAVIDHTLTQAQLDAGSLEVLVAYDVENENLEQTFALWIDGIQVNSVSMNLGGDWSGNNEASFAAASTTMAGNGSNGTISGDDFTSGVIDF